MHIKAKWVQIYLKVVKMSLKTVNVIVEVEVWDLASCQIENYLYLPVAHT